MYVLYQNTKINFTVFGKNNVGVPTLFLHGWARNHSDFIFFKKKDNYQIFIDFPPFGKSSKIIGSWGIEDYSLGVLAILDKLNIKKVNIVAHSFGGRVALFLASEYNDRVLNLVLTGCAGLKSKNWFINKFKIAFYKFKKKIGIISNAGSSDYQKLPTNMKQTFVKVIQQDLAKNAKKIKCKTLLIWGENDNATKVYQAKKYNKLIKNSKLIVLKDKTHFCFLEDKTKFKVLIENFLED